MTGHRGVDPVSESALARLGEFGLIHRVAARLGSPPPPAGVGDDAAVVPAPDGRLVATTDLLAEGVHFRWDWSSPYDVGHKAAAVNLADVAAMGAVPTALLVGIALPPATSLDVVDGIVDGLRAECARVGAVVVGGDTIASTDRITLAVTALGDLQGRPAITRRAAEAGELVLAGALGLAAAGLALLRADVRDSVFEPLLAAHRCPSPPYGAGPALALAGALAMTDVSDGLLADVGHLLEACDGGAQIDPARIPMDPLLVAAAARLGQDPMDWVLAGGEDHALVAVLPPGVHVPGTTVIGNLRPGGREGLTVPGIGPPGEAGHDHFKTGRP